MNQVHSYHVLVAHGDFHDFKTEGSDNKEHVEKIAKLLKEKMPDRDVYIVHTHSEFGHEETPTEVTL